MKDLKDVELALKQDIANIKLVMITGFTILGLVNAATALMIALK